MLRNNDNLLEQADHARAVIADDERLMRERLRARLGEFGRIGDRGGSQNGMEAVALTEQHHPDIVFLDIRMPGLTGVDAARQIAQLPTFDRANGWPGCEIVFITAYDQYAVQAFERGVVDYVLKPAERERLQLTVQRIQTRMAQREQAQYAVPNRNPTRCPPTHQPWRSCCSNWASRSARQSHQVAMDSGQRAQQHQMIPVEDVLFFISDEKYTRVQTASVEALIRKPSRS